MNVASSLALAVAERVERTGGPRAGLVAWKTLAGNSTDGELRGKALLAALRCALALRDETALGELTALWPSVDRGVWDASIAALCKEMVRAGLTGRATELAKTEAERHRTALSLYTHARLLDVSGDPGAASAFRAVIERASSEGAKEIVLTARIRRATILARSWETMTEALQEASAVNLGAAEGAAAPASAKLALARVLLFSPSRFVRASAIGVLDELAASSSSSGGAGIEALALAAAWADDAANSSVMTPLETDRLVALFGREPILKIAPHGKDAIRAIDRMMRSRESEVDALLDEMSSKLDPSLTPQHVRARDILRGRYEVPRTSESERERLPQDPTKRRAFRQQEILDVVVAMRDAAPARAARSLRMLAEAEEGGEHLPPEALAVAQAALEHESSAELRDVAVRVFSARLRRATYGAPPKGYLALADSLAALGRDELSATARRAAVSLKEPGAAESLGTALARQGWDYAKKGERASAIQKLREAKRLLD